MGSNAKGIGAARGPWLAMPAVRVRAVTPLWNLDRDLDYLIKDDQQIEIGQRVLVPLGKQKSSELAVVTAVLHSSPYASKPLERILNEPPAVTKGHLGFLDQVSRRYCVSLGEILHLAIPDYMPRAASALGEQTSVKATQSMSNHLTNRSVVLTKARSQIVAGQLIPDWAELSVRESSQSLSTGRSVLICVPEQSDIQVLTRSFAILAPEINVVGQAEAETKSQRYLRYRALQSNNPKVGIVTRSGILWEVANLGKVIVHDDLDDSLRESGSPFYSAWEVALLRSAKTVDVVFVAAYRSAQLQRLVEIGYLDSIGKGEPIRDIEFSRPEEVGQKSILPFLRKVVKNGTALVLTTRKGSNSSIYCKDCGTARTCTYCEGSYWVNSEKKIECRICLSEAIGSCQNCGSETLRFGKLGSSRIAADIGKALPGVRVIEIDTDLKQTVFGKANQVVIATTGSAPYLKAGYSGLVVFDAAAWQSSPHPTAQLIAHRDWLGAIELLKPNAPVYIRNVESGLAQDFVLGRYLESASKAVAVAKQDGLYPETKYFRIECDSHLSSELAEIVVSGEAEVLKIVTGSRSILIGRVLANKSLALADALRPWVKTQKPSKTNPKRRPVSIEFDFEAWR